METYSAELINAGFIERLDTREGQSKTAAASLTYIKDRLREASFTDMIIPNERVVRGDLQRSTEHDTLVKIVDIEPGSKAMPLNFRGLPTATYVNGKRYAIGFFTISSEKFEIVEQELMAYEMPVTRIIEENSLKDMVEVKDREFLIHVEACVEGMQSEGNGGAVAFNTSNVNDGSVVGVSKLKGSLALAATTNDFVVRAIQRPDIVNIKKLLKRQILDTSGNVIRAGRLRPAVMLITESDADDFDQWTLEDLGSQLTGETAVEGWSYNKAVGLRIIKTIKNDILREGNVYVFTAPEFFGRNYTLNDVKFYIDKIVNRIHWQAWMDVGMGIGNVAAVVKLELYSGSVVTGATDYGYEAAQPVAVENLGQQNNKVADGLTFPRVVVF
ncbi:MAG: hypothetical protein ACO27L_05405 [Schleiferiaceae bacterium]